ncbi:hypothetical protein N7460_012257 [Penicillium canescens]|uniref:Uncharacterized protein n=1 Tax=Penicillium canescens TaxID=5083 RepID=A0AAD6I224_PENCN|nr:hypothetical protein N7460_012257 [Penicillium canescens]
MHCLEAAQPIVTVLAIVLERGGQLNDGQNLLHYRLQTTVYNPSTRSSHTFPITAYFKNGQRWANFPPLNTNTHVFVTGRIFGLTKKIASWLSSPMMCIFFQPLLIICLRLLPQQLVNESESIVGPKEQAPPPPPKRAPAMKHPRSTRFILHPLKQIH